MMSEQVSFRVRIVHDPALRLIPLATDKKSNFTIVLDLKSIAQVELLLPVIIRVSL